MFWVELSLALLALLVAAVSPTFGAAWFERLERMFARIANRRGPAIAVIGFSALALRLAVLPIEPIPQAAVHDEFSYLLQADTFAHGRLTNPTPKMWEHFETFHVIFQPTYCGKYFPGQGLFLALGQVLFGHPFWGVWLTSGLMCAAITWMLLGWFSPGWAFLGGALTVLRFGVFGYWADSYWGGNVAAIGGALLLGALPRIKASQRIRDSLLMGVGLALLANSRPWEGLILSLPAAAILLFWMFGRNRPPLRLSLLRVALPLALVICAIAGWLAFYNWHTTGSPLRSAYQIYEQTYGTFPYMVWQHIRPEPVYRHAMMPKLEVDYVSALYANYHTPIGHLFRIIVVVSFFLGPILLLPFLALLLALPYGISLRRISSDAKTLLLFAIVSAAGTEMVVFYSPHYSAPATCLIIAFVLLALRRLRDWSKMGIFLTRAVPTACVLAFALRAAAGPLHINIRMDNTYGWNEFFLTMRKGWFPKAQIQSQLEAIPGNHLVIVQYSPPHLPMPEWVYNEADIEHSRIIWARDMGTAKNQELIDYYKDRKAWLLQADDVTPKLASYTAGESQSAMK